VCPDGVGGQGDAVSGVVAGLVVVDHQAAGLDEPARHGFGKSRDVAGANGQGVEQVGVGCWWRLFVQPSELDRQLIMAGGEFRAAAVGVAEGLVGGRAPAGALVAVGLVELVEGGGRQAPDPDDQLVQLADCRGAGGP
jgi:hypothetical protein